MGYIYLAIALFGGLLKGFSGKKSSTFADSTGSDIFINIIRMFICTVIGFIVVIMTNNLSKIGITAENLPIFITSAVSMSIFSVCFLIAYKGEAYMFICVFTMIGSMFTCLLSSLIFGEELGVKRMIGIIILIFSVYIMSTYNAKIKGRLSAKDFLILLTGGLCSGLADFCQKIYVHITGGSGSAEVFNFYTYFFGFIFLSLMLIIMGFFKKTKEKVHLNKLTLLLCFLMSIGLYINTTAKTFAATTLPAARIYPVLQGGNLIFSAIIVRLLFKERITVSSVIGLITAFVGILILNS